MRADEPRRRSHRLMKPLLLARYTATSCIGHGSEATFEAVKHQQCGLAPCQFETVRLDTSIGEVPRVEDERLPRSLQNFDCRNNRLAQAGLRQDGFHEAVWESVARWGRRRIGVFLGTSTSGILQTELAYRHRDPATGELPESFHYAETQNSFAVAEFVRRALHLEGP